MKKYGLIGYPLGHSLSPSLHCKLFYLSGVEADYSLYEIAPDKLNESYDFLDSLDGFNITIPHKIAVMPYCSAIDEEAVGFGAINCVHNKKGYNTDVFGLLKSLTVQGYNINKNPKILILGYGGAGRMAAKSLLDLGGNITVAARQPNKVDTPYKAVPLSGLSGDYDLILNSTPLGMYPNTAETPVDFNNLRCKYAFDMIFNPTETVFMKEAKKIGANVMGGLHMLVWQAVRSHEIWHGGEYTEEDIDTIISELRAML